MVNKYHYICITEDYIYFKYAINNLSYCISKNNITKTSYIRFNTWLYNNPPKHVTFINMGTELYY